MTADTADWTPDEQLVPALLAGSATTMADLDPCDRAWAVAAMNLEGMTAEQIRDRLACSLRLVRAILAEPGAVFARLYMIERDSFAATYRMSGAEVTRLARALEVANAERDRYKTQFNALLDRVLSGESGPVFPRCGHPKTRYNTYKAPKTGKESCRACHVEAQRRYESRVKLAATG